MNNNWGKLMKENEKPNNSEEETFVPPKPDQDTQEPIEQQDLSAVDSQTEPKKAKRKLPVKKILIVFLILIAAGGLAYGGYWFYMKKDSSEPVHENQNQSQSTETENPVSSAEPQELTETYSSSALRLDFMYPADWKVNEVDRGITVSSPEFSFTAANGEEVQGFFKVYIRKGARSVDSNYLEKGFAISDSEQISYSEPESGQRKDTYLTNFGPENSDDFLYFIVQGNFDLKKGDTLGPKYAKEVDAYLIVGGYSDKSKTDDLSTNTMSGDSFSQTSQYATGVEIVKSLKLR